MVKDFFDSYVSNFNYLMNLTIELTTACNLKCCHCYVEDRANKTCIKYLDKELVHKVTNEALELNAVSITLTGGEPLLHPDIFDIVKYIKQKGFFLTLKTNGTLINEDNVKYIKEYIDHIILTKYGCSKGIYERITRIPGSYNKYLHALELLQTNKVPYKENSILLSENECELDEFLESTSMVDAYISVNCDNKYALTHRPSDTALYRLFKKNYSKITLGKYETVGEQTRVCNCGECSLTVNAEGEINPCTSFYFSLGNCRQQSLGDIWFSIERKNLIEKCKVKYFNKCMTCSDKKYLLSIAPCNNYTESKNMNSIPDELCRHCRILKRVHEEESNGNSF